jgi:hypothetical protein
MTTNATFVLPASVLLGSERLTGAKRPTLSRHVTYAEWYTYEGVEYATDGTLKKAGVAFTGRTWITSQGIFPTRVKVTVASGEVFSIIRRPCGELILEGTDVLILPARQGISESQLKDAKYWQDLLEKAQKQLAVAA